MAIIMAVVGGGLAAYRGFVSAPAVETLTARPFMPHDPTGDEFAFDIAEPHPEDALLNVSPFTFAEADGWARKPDFYTILVFGYDEGLNTDTIMVAAFDVGSRQAYILSIPRDTRIDVRRNVQRINSAYPVGIRFNGGHDGGVDQLKREVQTIIGFRPDFYVSVEEAAFERIIDAVGGVTVYVPFHMRYDDQLGFRINIPAGYQRLDGENALHFVRYRLGTGSQTITDFQRMEHQQQLIAALMDELMSPRTILRIPELIRTYSDHVNTNLSVGEILYFGEQFVLGEIELHSYNYPTTSTRIQISETQTRWYEIPQAEAALEIINNTINPFTRDLTMENLQLAR